eukprot:scaffold2113_cov233-Pinguiococcus_pyrenoidosus.AAC.9
MLAVEARRDGEAKLLLRVPLAVELLHQSLRPADVPGPVPRRVGHVRGVQGHLQHEEAVLLAVDALAGSRAEDVPLRVGSHEGGASVG